MNFEINIRRTAIEVIGILLLSIVAGISYNGLSKRGISLIAPKVIEESQSTPSRAGESGNLQRISLKDAYNFFSNGEAVFLDARSEEEFKKGHIKNAVSLPYTLPISKKSETLSDIPKSVPLVTYCDGAECNASEVLAIELAELGYTRVMIFFGGWTQWQKAKYPGEK
ncbi:MAG: hypothetical protein A2149_09690 [Candidatus Schekmanbacteria bacterium RBG_16_38_11]|uniref:Rhodanese domain-containing protein n=1 Tax=Candidatus Schekmanbacteria bacterium RBG_16_38_11 TaxID=1817880 RepID=A0A1F7RU47_9BACT|nr:MAG: hypothetical protein A2149_09690 [Candidatus Schekmanbacteria bacterium RBG_16_38_11]